MNKPAMISFFSVAGVILLVAGIAVWRTQRTSRVNSTTGDGAIENGNPPRHGTQGLTICAGDRADADGQADNRGGSWRWRKKPDQALISVSIAGVKAETSLQSDVEKGPRPQDVPSFENLGGYRFGCFAYGHDNMAPLPLPASFEDLKPYHHAPGIAEVEAVPASSYPPIRIADRISVESGHASRLTSYNGLPPLQQHRDDMMAALPIPKDHPLYQHHPVVHRPAPPQQNPDRRPPTFQYERESLVPAPLNPRRGKHSPHVDQSHKPISTVEPTPAAVLNWERPWSAHSRPASTSRSTSGDRSETRYSSFESPLRQHPPELKTGLQDARDMAAQSPVHEPSAIASEVGARDEVQNDWPLTTHMKSPVQRYSVQTPKQPLLRCCLDDGSPDAVVTFILQAIEMELDGRGFQGGGDGGRQYRLKVATIAGTIQVVDEW